MSAALVLMTTPLYAQYPGALPPPPCEAGSERSLQPSVRREPNRGIAVLQFGNYGSEQADAYLAAALTDGIASRLRKVDRFGVRARGIAPDLAPATPQDVIEFGRELGARYLVSGLVTRTRSGLSVTVQLDEAQRGSRVWSAQYERRSPWMLAAVQDTIAREVARRMAGKLSPQETAALAGPAPQNAVAYDHLLRGNYYLSQRSPHSVAQAIEEYRAAVIVHPAVVDFTFAKALTGLAQSYSLLLHSGWEYRGLPREALLNRGWSAIKRALEQDPRSADVWLARASLLEFRNARTFDGVKAAYDRALSLDPENAEAHHHYGRALMRMGEYRAASARLKRALELDPDLAEAHVDLAEISFAARSYTDACRLLNTAIATGVRLPHAYALRARVRLGLGEYRDAWADAETTARLGDALGGEALSAILQAAARDTAAARTRVGRLMRASSSSQRSLTAANARYLALALVALGDKRPALDVLERVQPRGAALWMVLQDPGLAPLRPEARYRRLLREVREGSVALR